MIELIERKRNVAEVNTLSPLTWAYVGSQCALFWSVESDFL